MCCDLQASASDSLVPWKLLQADFLLRADSDVFKPIKYSKKPFSSQKKSHSQILGTCITILKQIKRIRRQTFILLFPGEINFQT